MESVFISSIQRGFEEIRAAARRGVESVRMRPLMAELAGASTSSPRRALLDLVADGNVFLLLLGPRYSRPTEEEYDEARRLGKRILVLKQEVDFEPEQAAFLERVAGGWEGGRLWGKFRDAVDVGFAVVEALTGLAPAEQDAALRPEAQERARALAVGVRRQGYSGHRSTARVALVPLVATSLLDALTLDDALGEAVADLARGARLVPHSVGLSAKVSGRGVTLGLANQHYIGEGGFIEIGTDGAMVCEIDVGGDGQLAGTRVDSTLLASGISSVGAFALRVWERIDPRDEVQQAAVALAILDAQHKVFDLAPEARSYSMSSRMPGQVVVPEPAVIARRAEVAGEELTMRLVAEARRVFADAGAIAS